MLDANDKRLTNHEGVEFPNWHRQEVFATAPESDRFNTTKQGANRIELQMIETRNQSNLSNDRKVVLTNTAVPWHR